MRGQYGFEIRLARGISIILASKLRISDVRYPGAMSLADHKIDISRRMALCLLDSGLYGVYPVVTASNMDSPISRRIVMPVVKD
jgi:hypothetical protein